MSETYYLCYSEGTWAWFASTDDFSKIHSDDWDDGHRQGIPYDVKGGELLKVGIDGPIQDANWEMPPDSINEAEMAWLKSNQWADNPVSIQAKATLEETIELVHKAGGEVYTPVGENDE